MCESWCAQIICILLYIDSFIVPFSKLTKLLNILLAAGCSSTLTSFSHVILKAGASFVQWRNLNHMDKTVFHGLLRTSSRWPERS